MLLFIHLYYVICYYIYIQYYNTLKYHNEEQLA